ncbi:hypothetical protein [Vibrio rotiferianus]|uniref:hypothetical protein n=1 Tax=Vibrio rotiferianus TaxID=190895 RepID=UPI003908F77F
MKIKDDKNKFKGLSNIKNASTWFDVLKSDDRSAVLISCAAFDAKLERILLSIKFEVRHFLQMRMNILRWCPIPKSFAWARI